MYIIKLIIFNSLYFVGVKRIIITIHLFSKYLYKNNNNNNKIQVIATINRWDLYANVVYVLKKKIVKIGKNSRV